MSLTWVKSRQFETWEAEQNGRRVGAVIPRDDGSVVWKIDAVHMKWIAKGYGESKSVSAAKRALSRAWKIWLEHFGLAPA
jgi:hypothetical protein